MTSPLTVVVPVFNGAGLLGDTLESLRRQTAAPHEVIVIDDGSTDRSADVAAEHPLAPRVVRLGSNCGAAFARNTGLLEADTELVAFLDQDDLWLPWRTARLARAFRDNPEWRVLVTTERAFAAEEDRRHLESMEHPFSSMVTFWRPTARVLSLLDDVPADPDPVRSERIPTVRLLAGSVSVTTSYVLDRRLALQVGGFAGWLRAADDWVLLQTLSRHTQIRRLHDASVLYRVHPANTSAATEWPMRLMVSAAAVRFGGGVVDGATARDPDSVGRLRDSAFLMHHLEARAAAGSRRSRADSWAAWQLLATDRADRGSTARRLIRVAVQSFVRSRFREQRQRHV